MILDVPAGFRNCNLPNKTQIYYYLSQLVPYFIIITITSIIIHNSNHYHPSYI
jgi:hypothetical protein